MPTSEVYATEAELRSIPEMDSASNDAVLLILLTAASRAVDGFCNRREDGFKAPLTGTSRLFVGSGVGYVVINEAAEVSAVEYLSSSTDSTYTTLDAAYWLAFSGSSDRPTFLPPYVGISLNRLAPIQAFVDGTPQEDGEASMPTVRVTAKWGYATTTPPLVKSATILQASRWFKRGQAFWSDVAASNDMGRLMFMQAIDPDIKMMLTLSQLVRPLYG